MTAVMDPTQLTIGDALRKARLRPPNGGRKLSQTQVAKAIGTSTSRVSRWENGEDYPSIPEYQRFIELTGITSDVGFLPRSC